MNEPHDPKLTQPPVNEGRRRLAKAGLAAPAVLGVLASRPVLGNSLHHCTPSGHISGFASPRPDAAPCNVGNSVSHYAGSLSNWPEEFKTLEGKTRLFKESPAGAGLVLFADAYQRSDGAAATVWDVLKGYPVDDVGNLIPGLTLVAKKNTVDIELGQQALAACMNAFKVLNFPIQPQTAVKMFNGVLDDGTDNVTDTNSWNYVELKAYFQTLQGS
ncbi:MAG: hypothetical protein MUC79_04095 [Thiobacillaceae bacterium]|jgi:hypothetical protein|nr:hypothetical protein [Thiobacillaceae bacterium]